MTKPTFNLNDPLVRHLTTMYGERAHTAYEIAQQKDDAVRPVYALSAHSDRVEQEGSCVLLAVADQFFALSGSHVFDAVGPYALLIGCGASLHELTGDRFSSARGHSGTHRDDPIDASVFHVTTDIPSEVRASALSLADFDLSPANPSNEFYVMSGYRASKSKTTSHGHTTEIERFPTVELDLEHYQHWQLEREKHLLLSLEDQVAVNMRWQTAPSIRGMSGGAMFRVDGLEPASSSRNSNRPEVRLSAILTERRKGNGNHFSVALGTRINVHFGLIHHWLPELRFDKMIMDEYQRRMQQQQRR